MLCYILKHVLYWIRNFYFWIITCVMNIIFQKTFQCSFTKCNRFIFFCFYFCFKRRYHNKTWYVGIQANQRTCLLHKIFCASINIALNMHSTIRLCKRVSCGLMWKICKNITVPLCKSGYLNKTFFKYRRLIVHISTYIHYA